MRNNNNADDGLLLGLIIGSMMCNGNKSNNNSGCLGVILAVLAVPALITWIAIAA